MYILFTKKHPAGIAKGEVRNIQEAQALKMINKKFAEEITKEQYDELRIPMMEALEKRVADNNTNAQKQTDVKEEEASERKEETEEVKKKAGIGVKVKKEETKINDTRKFIKVTEEMREDNPDFVSRGIRVGDEIVEADNGQPLRDSEGYYIGRDGALGKPQPSSEGSVEGGEKEEKDSTDGGDGSAEDTEVKYHTLTQEDFNADEELEKEGLKIGDEVEMQSDGDLAVDGDGKLIKKTK